MSSEPDWIQVNIGTSCSRVVGGLAETEANIATPSTKAASTVAQPTMWPTRSSSRPPTSSTIAPASGSAISSQEAP